MNLKQLFNRYSHWTGIGLFAVSWLMLLAFSQPIPSIVVVSMLLTGAVIENYVIRKTGVSLSQFYYPILPKKYDFPLSIVVWVSLIVKTILIVNWEHNPLNCYWVGCALSVMWIASHLCSRE